MNECGHIDAPPYTYAMVRDPCGVGPTHRRNRPGKSKRMQLVPIITMEEVELALVSMRIAWRTEELRQLERQLAPLEAAFSAFEIRVADRAGGLTVERDRLLHICSELESYTARIHARLAADPEGHLDAVFAPEELRAIGELLGVEVPESWFGRESRATTSGDGWYSTDGTWAGASRIHLRTESPADVEELRTLYRQLARAFHPDLAENDSERALRQEMMLRINHAWHMRDLPAMREIVADGNDLVSGRMKSAISYRLAWHRRELARLEAECIRLQGRITSLRSSKTATLWHNSTLANAAISRHISRLQREIDDLSSRHQSAMEEFRVALGIYASMR